LGGPPGGGGVSGHLGLFAHYSTGTTHTKHSRINFHQAARDNSTLLHFDSIAGRHMET